MSVTRRHMGAVGLGFAAAAFFATWPRALCAATDADLSGHPNVFISPCGQPFRAAAGEAYPVVAWFKQADRNADGRLDKAEFIADAEAFFKILDRNGDGVLGPIEVAIYEQRIAPEILGARFTQGAAPAANPWAGLLRLAQVHGPGPIDPGGASSADDLPPTPRHLDESGEGASPFSFFDEPEPVMAADLSFRGLVSKAGFVRLADVHFTTLDSDNQGYLTLEKLPQTPVQRALERGNRKRRKP